MKRQCIITMCVMFLLDFYLLFLFYIDIYINAVIICIYLHLYDRDYHSSGILLFFAMTILNYLVILILLDLACTAFEFKSVRMWRNGLTIEIRTSFLSPPKRLCQVTSSRIHSNFYVYKATMADNVEMRAMAKDLAKDAMASQVTKETNSKVK